MTFEDRVQAQRLHVFRRAEELGVTAACWEAGNLALALLPAPEALRGLPARWRAGSRPVRGELRPCRRMLSFLTSMNPPRGRFSHHLEPTAEAVFSPP